MKLLAFEAVELVPPRIGHVPIAVTMFSLGARNATAAATILLVAWLHRQEQQTVEVVRVLAASVALETGSVLHAEMLGSDGTVVKS